MLRCFAFAGFGGGAAALIGSGVLAGAAGAWLIGLLPAPFAATAGFVAGLFAARGYADVSIIARALVATAPERCVWASNWPHPGRDVVPDTPLMLDLLLDWADDDATRRRILTDNPAKLYGF